MENNNKVKVKFKLDEDHFIFLEIEESKLPSYGEEKLTYDASGNLLMKYCELTLTWEKGRRLKSASNGSESVAYTYEYNLLE